MTRLFEPDELFDYSVPSPTRPYTPPDTRNPIRAYNPRGEFGRVEVPGDSGLFIEPIDHEAHETFTREYLRQLSDALDPPAPEDDSEEAMRYRMRARVAFLRQGPVVDPKTTQTIPGRSEELKGYFERIAALRSRDEIDSARVLGINMARLNRGLDPLTSVEVKLLTESHPPFELSEYRDPSLEPTLGERIEEKVMDAVIRKVRDWSERTVHYGARGGKQALLEEHARDAKREGKAVVRLSPVEKNRR